MRIRKKGRLRNVNPFDEHSQGWHFWFPLSTSPGVTGIQVISWKLGTSWGEVRVYNFPPQDRNVVNPKEIGHGWEQEDCCFEMWVSAQQPPSHLFFFLKDVRSLETHMQMLM